MSTSMKPACLEDSLILRTMFGMDKELRTDLAEGLDEHSTSLVLKEQRK